MITTRVRSNWFKCFVARADGAPGVFFGRDYLEVTGRAQAWAGGAESWAEYCDLIAEARAA